MKTLLEIQNQYIWDLQKLLCELDPAAWNAMSKDQQWCIPDLVDAIARAEKHKALKPKDAS